ncbi:MAG: glycosyl transferase family 2-domain-containing protein [Olpidium bornovanus]|uniref:dolichyl-phosphate beta-D-mannosyltransferase n=1 Tax=Olpidium bornovanus TaxID=278681 RepID=A0A8H8A2F0_9FUNG|nr:MAG: glycosyl transferase family 2-domain-containing protein [Olpidium bornovanus]
MTNDAGRLLGVREVRLRFMATRRPAHDAVPLAAAVTHSVVVPAYKEGPNLRPLVTRLFAALAGPASPVDARHAEVVVVDDNSRDGSVEEVEALRAEGYNVRIIVRTAERGLSSAVVRGFREALGESMVCMDADLQVKTPARVGACAPGNAFRDAALCHRDSVRRRGEDGRELASAPPRHINRRSPAVAASDRRERPDDRVLWTQEENGVPRPWRFQFLRAGSVNPHGFKIALDLLVKAKIPASSVCEYPFSFGVRTAGESKLDSKVMVRYLEQLAELYRFRFGPFVYVFLLSAVLAVLCVTFLAARMLWT